MKSFFQMTRALVARKRKIFALFFALAASIGLSWATTVTWDSNTISSISLRDGGQSFTKDGVTLTLLDGRIAGTRDWRGNSVEASFKFSTSLGNFTRIEITATIRGLEGSGWTETSPGAVWTGDANETTFGNYFKDVTQIVFTIGEATTAVTGVTLNKSAAELTVGGENLTLIPTVLPSNATNKEVMWTSDNGYVAVVENGGVVIPVGPGTANITVTTVEGDYSATCVVTVTDAAPTNACGDGLIWELNNGELTISYTGTGTGVMDNYAKSSDAPWYSYKNDITSVTITDGVKSVGSYSFGYYGNLVTVTIGNDVETIGEYAFGDCYKFTTLNLGNSVKHIGNRAFMWAKVLTGFTLPSTLETIGDRAFLQNKLITSLTIPSSVTSIGQSAFMYCAALTSITVEATTPPTLKETVFDGVPTSIPLHVPNGSVAAYTAADQWNAFNIQGYDPAPGGGSTPANVCGDGLTWELNGGVLTISYDGEGTGEMTDFGYENDQNPVNVAPWKENKSEITTVIVGDGVKSIGNYAFNDLSENFTAVTIANSVERIGVFAFTNSEEITEITLPSSLKTIDEQCFANCGFTSITIPSGVTSIGYKAFSWCRNLTSLTCEATTPPALASSVFYKISNTSSIPLYVPSESVTAYEAAAQWNAFDIQGYDPASTANLKLIEFQAPASWENDNSPITSADFPGFVATTYEIASALPINSDEPSLVIFDFPENDEVTVYTKMGEQVKEPSTGTIVRSAIFENAQAHYYYPVLAGGGSTATVTWNSSNISDLIVFSISESYSKEGVTLSGNADKIEAYWYGSDENNSGISFHANATGGFTFSNTLGKNFTKIEMTLNVLGGWNYANLGSGWNIDGMKAIWTGNASTVDLLKDESGFNSTPVNSIVFYFEGDSEGGGSTDVIPCTAADLGKVLCTDGSIYATVSEAAAASKTAAAVIAYVDTQNGKALALALADDGGEMDWATAKTTAAAHTPAVSGGTWTLASKDEWDNMINAAGSYTALRDGFSGVGGTNMKNVGYWSSTSFMNYAWCYKFNNGEWFDDYQEGDNYVRACLAFDIPATPAYETVMNLIDAIGTVELTAECKAKIDAARAAYNALSDEDKAQVTNLTTLTNAEAAYAGLLAEKVAPVIAAINAVPATPLTDATKKLSEYNKVTDAREAYDALSDEEKAAVTNYGKLEEAEAAFAAIPSVGSETVITWDKNTGIEKISGTTTSPAYEGITISIKGGGFGPEKDMLRFNIAGLGLSFEFANTLGGNFQKIVISSTNAMPSTPLAGMGEGWAASNENKTATWTGDAATVKIWDGLTATSYWDVNTIQFTLGATVSATEAAQAAKDLIDAIGEVSYPGSKEAIKAAREAVDALGANASLLDDADLQKLTQAETTYAQLLAQAVAAVKEQIEALPDTPLTDATKKLSEYNKVTDAREAYDALSDEEKAAVTNYGKLEAAEAAFAAIGGGTGLNVSTEDIGKVLCADGSLYATKDEATAASKTPVAMIAYVEDSKGLAIALEDESNTMIWSTAITTAAAHTPAVTGGTWKLPSLLEWQQMFVGCGADLTPSETSGAVTDYIGLRDKLLAAGGKGFVEWSYWTTTEWADNPEEAWDPYFSFSPEIVKWYTNKKDRDDFYIRAILAFNVVASKALADAQAAKDLIDAIPQEVVYTPECGAAIKAAREAVDALGENASLLDDADLNKLTQAEATYAQLLAQAVAAVKEQIEALPDTPLTDATKKLSEYNKVVDAREAYDALSDEEKAAVDNYGKLTAAEAAFADIDKGGITIYDSGSVALTDLKIGDVLKGGVTLIGEASDNIGVRRVAMNGATKEGVFYNLPFQYMNPLLGENAAISHGPNVFSPIAEDGNAGDAWIVTDKYAQATVWLRGISTAALPSVLADAQAAKDLIDAIPQEVVLSDECNAAIQAARDAVTALGENASLLDDADIDKLAKAEADFALLIKDATAVADKIAAIGEVTFSAESKGKIEDAREAYEALSDELKPYVSNLGTLTAAEAAYEAARPFAPVTTVPAAVEALQYTGAAQALITAGAAEHGTILYSLDGENYSTELPTALLPGAYTIYYKVQATDDYKDVAPVTVIATIAYNYPATYGLFGIPEGWSVKVNDEEVAVVNGAVKNIAANDRFDIMPVKPEDVKRVEIVPYLLDLATVTDSVIYILDGDSITGTANGHITVVIVPDAKVYFKDVNLTNTGSHPAVLCGGNAEIVVVGENMITCTKEDEYGIRAAGAGTTLTVSGDKTLLKATIDPNGGTVNQ